MKLDGRVELVSSRESQDFRIVQVLVFSTMTRLLDIVEDQLDWRGIQYLRLDGSTASAERGELVCHAL